MAATRGPAQRQPNCSMAEKAQAGSWGGSRSPAARTAAGTGWINCAFPASGAQARGGRSVSGRAGAAAVAYQGSTSLFPRRVPLFSQGGCFSGGLESRPTRTLLRPVRNGGAFFCAGRADEDESNLGRTLGAFRPRVEAGAVGPAALGPWSPCRTRVGRCSPSGH